MHKLSMGALLSALAAGVVYAAEPATFTIERFAVQGSAVVAAETVAAAVAPFAGSGRSMADINRAVAALKAAYLDAGYPIVQVIAPEQVVSDGVIVLRVVEGKLKKVTVTGNKDYAPENIRASLPPLKEGTAPNAPAVVAAIVLANENPAKQVAVNFQAGTSPGEVEARIDVTEDAVEKTTLTVDNSGSLASGVNRVSLGYQNANIGQRDHMLTLALNTTTERPEKSLNLVAGYRIPFYAQGLSLDLIASYSDTRTTTTATSGDLFFSGKGIYAGVRLNQALTSVGEWRHKLVYGADYKDFANRCEVGGNEQDVCGAVTAIPLSLGYVFQAATPTWQIAGNVTYAANPGGGVRSGPSRYDEARAGANPHWDVWRGMLTAAMPLPGDWQVRGTANAQDSNKVLIPGEQFGLGGANSIRGYAERAVAGDSGYQASAELYTPDVGALVIDGLKLRGLVFYDEGRVRTNGAAGTQETRLASIGLGVRVNYGKQLAVKADVGFSQTTAAEQTEGVPIRTMPMRQAWGLKPANDPWGLHVSATYTF